MIINGEKVEVVIGAIKMRTISLSFEDIAYLVYERYGISPTITYHKAAQDKTEGMLIPGQRVRVSDDTQINCVFTNNA